MVLTGGTSAFSWLTVSFLSYGRAASSISPGQLPPAGQPSMNFKKTATTFAHMSQSFTTRCTPCEPRNRSRSVPTEASWRRESSRVVLRSTGEVSQVFA